MAESQPKRTEARVAINEQEFEEMQERQVRIEQSFDRLTNTTEQLAENQRQLAENQQTQQKALGDLTGDVQSILTLLRTREGRFDLKTVVAVIVPLAGFVVFFLAMYVSPLTQTINEVRHQLDEHLASDGTTKTQVRLATDELQQKINVEAIRNLQIHERQRLEEEAAIGRAASRSGFIPSVIK